VIGTEVNKEMCETVVWGSRHSGTCGTDSELALLIKYKENRGAT
jgi:hypothetical protein